MLRWLADVMTIRYRSVMHMLVVERWLLLGLDLTGVEHPFPPRKGHHQGGQGPGHVANL